LTNKKKKRTKKYFEIFSLDLAFLLREVQGVICLGGREKPDTGPAATGVKREQAT